MNEELTFGLTSSEISLLSTVAQIIISIVALLLTLINLRILRRLNIVDSMRRVNDKFTELNILELENETLIPFSHLNGIDRKDAKQEHIEEQKQTNMLFNHINILEGVYVEMKYKTMKKEHAMKILNQFVPPLVNDLKGKMLIQNSGYDDDFVSFCLKYIRDAKPDKINATKENKSDKTQDIGKTTKGTNT